MKKLVTVLLSLSSIAAFAAENPSFTCDSKHSEGRVVVQAQEQTPYAKKLVILVNGKKYYALKLQNIGMGSSVSTIIYCIETKEIKSCSYATHKNFAELTFKSKPVELLSVKSEAINLDIECVKGHIIW